MTTYMAVDGQRCAGVSKAVQRVEQDGEEGRSGPGERWIWWQRCILNSGPFPGLICLYRASSQVEYSRSQTARIACRALIRTGLPMMEIVDLDVIRKGITETNMFKWQK